MKDNQYARSIAPIILSLDFEGADAGRSPRGREADKND